MIGLQRPEIPTWPSIDHAKPSEEGGPIARIGFDYQDEFAVSLLIDMLGDATMLKIHLETHDDIVVVQSGEERTTAEYIQVKSAELNQLWSVATLCRRENGEGTSIFEISLGRDKHLEISRFRLVTLRPVAAELKVLTLPRGATGREPCGSGFLLLQDELCRRFPGVRSPKNNDVAYWLKHCHWDVPESERALSSSNIIRLLRFATSDGKSLLLDHIDLLLEELRSWAKSAGEARWEPNRLAKIISREQLRAWWDRRTAEILDGASAQSGGKLAAKMRAAALTEDQVLMAIDLRREYGTIIRTSRYMENQASQRLQSQAKAELASLRAGYVAGQLPVDSLAFHALCIERMKSINTNRPAGIEDHTSFLIGCMYDITDRCLHKFERPLP